MYNNDQCHFLMCLSIMLQTLSNEKKTNYTVLHILDTVKIVNIIFVMSFFPFSFAFSWNHPLMHRLLKNYELLLQRQEMVNSGCQKVFKFQADNEQQVTLKLASKAQVVEGRGIQGYFEIQSLRNAISRVFKRYFPPQTPCWFVRIHSKLGTMQSKCSGIPQHRMVQTFHTSKPV